MGSRSYYEAVARIIPILFLTMAIGEARIRVRDSLSIKTAVFGVLGIGALMAAGEVAALRATESGHSSRIAKDLMAIGVGVGIAWLVRTLAEVVYRDRLDDEDASEPGTAVAIDAAFVVTAIGVICALIL